MGKSTEHRRSQQLGMSVGKARNLLVRNLLYSLACQTGSNLCFQCGTQICSAEEMTIEHKQPYLDASAALFWDIENIAFSHAGCDRPNRPKGPPRRIQVDGKVWCYKCKLHLDPEMFWKKKKNLTGYNKVCKQCYEAHYRKR